MKTIDHLADNMAEERAPSNLETLARSIAERRVILFAGAGLSISLGLPSWRDLIDNMCVAVGLDPNGIAGADSYRTLAEYYRLKQGNVESLRRWMDQSWASSRDRVLRSPIHKLVIELDFPIIYTTNYDRNFETAYEAHGKPYVKIANARDLARVTPDATQIIKFHGDFDDETSLVITETDYFNRLRFDSPLDVKFRADALGKSVLFVGYSMSDMNIRFLLHWLWRTWQESGYREDRPPSFIFMTHENEMEAAVLRQWGVVALVGNRPDPEQAVGGFLEDLVARSRAALSGRGDVCQRDLHD